MFATDLEDQDMRFLYRAYRLGMLPFKARPDLSPAEFLAEVAVFLSEQYQYAWAVKSATETIAVGFGIASRSFVLLADVIWSPKATPRQKLEAGVLFFGVIKDMLVVLVEAGMGDKTYFDHMEDYHLLRRVGTFFRHDGTRIAQFQTKT